MEAEELRYEKEVLEWKLQEAAGSRYAPPLTQSIWSGPQPGIGPQPAFNGTIERAIQAKHVSIYPTMQEVCSCVFCSSNLYYSNMVCVNGAGWLIVNSSMFMFSSDCHRFSHYRVPTPPGKSWNFVEFPDLDFAGT